MASGAVRAGRVDGDVPGRQGGAVSDDGDGVVDARAEAGEGRGGAWETRADVTKGAVRSSSSACGDSTYHYCDIYPCMYERAFGSVTPNENAWKLKYIQRSVREIKTAIPEDKLFNGSHDHRQGWSRHRRQGGESHSSIPRFHLRRRRFRRNLPVHPTRPWRSLAFAPVAKAWTITVIVLSVYIGFFAAKKDPARKSLRALFVESVDVAHKPVMKTFVIKCAAVPSRSSGKTCPEPKRGTRGRDDARRRSRRRSSQT